LISAAVLASLSLAIHELATNALKYGALTMENGHVSIAWRYQDQQGEPKFVFIWRKLGGPPAAELPLWFGPRLISGILPDDFGGFVEMSHESTGFV
jgi:two-component sensor histidine kinase